MMAMGSRMGSRFLVCPRCGRKGVTTRNTGSTDWWCCRFRWLGCDWWCWAESGDRIDRARRAKLAQANPTRPVFVGEPGPGWP